jgi:CheY-like chemotaxis protein
LTLNAIRNTTSAGPASRGRVLYAEDQMTARTVTTALLERMGYDVVAVEDGELALDAARTEQFDVILLDIEMPVMDGVTAARSIRKEVAHAKETPILALSAFLADSTEHSPWRDAFDSALPKPANGNQLKDAMRKAMSRTQAKKAVVGTKGTVTWADFGRNLPTGTAYLVTRVAFEEIEHLILGWAACLDAGDKDCNGAFRERLTRLAESFEASEVVVALIALGENIQKPDLHRLLVTAAQWRASHMTRAQK